MYYSHARFALEDGLNSLGFKDNDIVLIPDYICEAVLQPFICLNIRIIFYKIDESFCVLKNSLETQIKENDQIKAIMMVHFFGQPADIDWFRYITKKYNLYLIEDNAHGFGGVVDGKLLGKFGDIGISSPRKIINCQHGGILYLGDQKYLMKSSMHKANIFLTISSILKQGLSYSPLIKEILRKLLRKKIIFSEPEDLVENYIYQTKVDFLSNFLLKKAENQSYINKIAINRRIQWNILMDVTEKLGGQRVFNNIHDTSCPWAYPFYVNDWNKREELIFELKKMGYECFSWPALPKYNDTIELDLRNRWKRLICISLKN